VKQVSGGYDLYYLWSSVLGEPVVELTNSGGIYRAYVYSPSGQAMALQSNDSNFYWVHTDHLGSGRKVTNTSGTVVYRAEFDPHGQTLYEWASGGATFVNSHKFTGYERDWATNLDYAKARTYTRYRARFIQPDPLGIAAADLTNPQSLNRYGYVGNDPANTTDPSGLLPSAEDSWSSVSGGFWGWGSPHGTGWGSDPRPGLRTIIEGEVRNFPWTRVRIPGFEGQHVPFISMFAYLFWDGGGNPKTWRTNLKQGLRNRFKNPRCAAFIQDMRKGLGINKPLVNLADSLSVKLAPTYDDKGMKIAGRFYPDERKITISPVTTSDFSTKAEADHYYSIILIHELFHYTDNPNIPYTPHFAIVLTAKNIGLTEWEKKDLEAINKLSGEERDDAMSNFATQIFQSRCPD
jgi:RHS repeat-associated protein